MGIKFKVDGVDVTDKVNPPQPSVEGVTRNQLWETINENTQLKQENYILKSKLEQINRLLQD